MEGLVALSGEPGGGPGGGAGGTFWRAWWHFLAMKKSIQNRVFREFAVFCSTELPFFLTRFAVFCHPQIAVFSGRVAVLCRPPVAVFCRFAVLPVFFTSSSLVASPLFLCLAYIGKR